MLPTRREFLKYSLAATASTIATLSGVDRLFAECPGVSLFFDAVAGENIYELIGGEAKQIPPNTPLKLRLFLESVGPNTEKTNEAAKAYILRDNNKIVQRPFIPNKDEGPHNPLKSQLFTNFSGYDEAENKLKNYLSCRLSVPIPSNLFVAFDGESGVLSITDKDKSSALIDSSVGTGIIIALAALTTWYMTHSKHTDPGPEIQSPAWAEPRPRLKPTFKPISEVFSDALNDLTNPTDYKIDE